MAKGLEPNPGLGTQASEKGWPMMAIWPYGARIILAFQITVAVLFTGHGQRILIISGILRDLGLMLQRGDRPRPPLRPVTW